MRRRSRACTRDAITCAEEDRLGECLRQAGSPVLHVFLERERGAAGWFAAADSGVVHANAVGAVLGERDSEQAGEPSHEDRPANEVRIMPR